MNKKIPTWLGMLIISASIFLAGYLIVASAKIDGDFCRKNYSSEVKNIKLAEQPADDSLPKITLLKCNIISKGINLKAAKTYSMLGDDEFDAAVCGYLVKKIENVPFVEDDSKQTNAYLNVVEFADSKFKDSVLKTIFEEGNTVNRASGQAVELNLGCLQKGEITGISYQSDPYIDAKTMASILASSVEKPVPLLLSFGIHDGRGCNCCNLMHKVRLIE